MLDVQNRAKSAICTLPNWEKALDSSLLYLVPPNEGLGSNAEVLVSPDHLDS